MVKEKVLQKLPNARPFILMRTGYSGAQKKFPTVPWRVATFLFRRIAVSL